RAARAARRLGGAVRAMAVGALPRARLGHRPRRCGRGRPYPPGLAIRALRARPQLPGASGAGRRRARTAPRLSRGASQVPRLVPEGEPADPADRIRGLGHHGGRRGPCAGARSDAKDGASAAGRRLEGHEPLVWPRKPESSSSSKCNNLPYPLFDLRPPSLLPVHHGQYPDDDGPRLLDGLDRLEGRAAGRDAVLDHHHLLAAPAAAPDPAPGSMFLGVLPDAEGIEGGLPAPARGGNGVRHRVGAHGESPDGIGMPPGLPDRVEARLAYEREAFGAHGGGTAIDVVGGAEAGGKGEISPLDTALEQELFEARGRVHVRPKSDAGKPPRAGFSSRAAVQKAWVNSSTVLYRLLRSRSRPRMMTDSSAGENRIPLTA